MNTHNIQWISFDEQKRFGLVGFEYFPIIAYRLVGMLSLLSEDYELVLFPSKRISRDFAKKQAKKLRKDTEILGSLDETKEMSRYTILMDEQANKSLVLLNVLPTRESALRFLITFLNSFFIHIKDVPMRDREILNIVARSVFESLRHYNEKFGIKFVTADEFTRFLTINIFTKIRVSYAEHLALKDLSKYNNLEGEISRFASHKIDLIFSLTRKSKFHLLVDLLNLAGAYIDALSIVMSLSSKKSLFLSARNRFERENRNLAKRLSKKNDVKRALEAHRKRLADMEGYLSFENFVKAACTSLVSFFANIEPQYVWLEETGALCKACNWYLKQIEDNPNMWHPQLGSIDNFMELLFTVFNKINEYPRIYPEVPIACGYMLLQLLESLARFRRDKKYYQQALEIGQKLSRIMERNIREIKRKNPQSPLRHLDAALILTGLAKLSANFRKWETMEMLLNKAKVMAEKYNLTEIELMIHWSNFLFTHDYEELLQVYKLYSIVAKSDLLELEPQFKMIALLSAGVFEEKEKLKHYRDAADLSLSSPFSNALTLDVTSLQDDLFKRRIGYYISNLFLHVEQAERQESKDSMRTILEEAKAYALSLEAETGSPLDPENVFASKTMLIIRLLNNDIKQARECLRKLEKFRFNSSTNKHFLNKAQALVQGLENRNLKKILNILDLPFEKRDPWSRLLEKIIEVESKRFLDQQLKLFSRAILFVEGPTEEEILPILAEKIGINLKELGIGIVSLRGSSKGKYHLKMWKEIAKNAPLPLFMLLDLDAKDDAKKAIEEGLVKKDNCFVLSLGSIEDYYPVEILIEVIKELCGRKPIPNDLVGRKVPVIDSFLKKNRYNKDWKLLVGKRVANLMDRTHMHPEIQEILQRIIDASVSQ